MVWTAIPGFFAAFGLTSLFVYLFNPLARRLRLLDFPGGRKDHADPTPVTGGLAIAAGTIVPALLVGEPSPSLTGLAVGILQIGIAALEREGGKVGQASPKCFAHSSGTVIGG